MRWYARAWEPCASWIVISWRNQTSSAKCSLTKLMRRQSLPKAVAAERKLRQINSDVRVEGIVADADSSNIEEFIERFHVVLDATDNFETRYLLNDAAVKLGIPWIYGAVVASYAATMTILPGRTACLACVFPKSPRGMHETCDTVGVIGPAVSWAAALQSTEALKILLGRESELHGSLARLRPVE